MVKVCLLTERVMGIHPLHWNDPRQTSYVGHVFVVVLVRVLDTVEEAEVEWVMGGVEYYQEGEGER